MKTTFLNKLKPSINPIVVKELYRAIKEVNRKGMTGVIVEQDVKRSLKFSDYSYILQEGKITLEGNPESFTEEMVKKAYFGI